METDDRLGEVLGALDAGLRAALDRLIDFVRIPSVSTDPAYAADVRRAAEWLRGELAALGFEAALRETAGHPVVLAGDFNVIPTDLDVYKPASWKRDALMQPESREAYENLLAQGWVDSLRHLHPEERIYTFWDYFRQHWQRNAGLRIDHILLNAELAPRLKKAGVHSWVRGQEHASDHAPVWIRLRAR